MNGQLFLALSLGLIGYLSRFYLNRDKIYYNLLTWISVLLMAAGIVFLMIDGVFGGVIAIITILTIIVMAKGLESDKIFLGKIYSMVEEHRNENPDGSDAEIMEKVIELNFSNIQKPIINEIISGSEDIEEMISKVVEFDASGKIRKPYPPENLDDLEDY